MDIKSFDFLVLFLPVVFFIYSSFKNMRIKNIVLLSASLIFYSFFDYKYLAFLILSIIIVYFGAKFSIKYDKKILIIALISNILILFVFKYGEFFLGNLNIALSLINVKISVPKILLPVGLSFYIFQSTSYLLDVYFGKVEVEKDIIALALFVSFFPTITSGPIQKSYKFLPIIKERKIYLLSNFSARYLSFYGDVSIK